MKLACALFLVLAVASNWGSHFFTSCFVDNSSLSQQTYRVPYLQRLSELIALSPYQELSDKRAEEKKNLRRKREDNDSPNVEDDSSANDEKVTSASSSGEEEVEKENEHVKSNIADALQQEDESNAGISLDGKNWEDEDEHIVEANSADLVNNEHVVEANQADLVNNEHVVEDNAAPAEDGAYTQTTQDEQAQDAFIRFFSPKPCIVLPGEEGSDKCKDVRGGNNKDYDIKVTYNEKEEHINRGENKCVNLNINDGSPPSKDGPSNIFINLSFVPNIPEEIINDFYHIIKRLKFMFEVMEPEENSVPSEMAGSAQEAKEEML
ncbi:hypothetical protein AK88_03613 [Plasmodium fragile]|uniref:Uncharacterized protein n=1 Tax=Plasmodium fragile TaxID=5857 RepID=A0A0D9QIE3_PLAFR|nr:uncharacterized protein AK88_03613 [Plasmodium fragile]KJP86799.1 hypothetical protein AK88_03613 [Plasmodium fragile]